MESFFHSKYKKVEPIVMSPIPHAPYIGPCYEDTSIMMKMRRTQYLDHMNHWLNSTAFLRDGEWASYEDLGEEQDGECESEHYDGVVGNASTYNDEWDEQNEWDRGYEGDEDESEDEYVPAVRVKDVCYSMYKDLRKAIDKAGFELYDENQFKEDFLYFVYRLSKIDCERL